MRSLRLFPGLRSITSRHHLGIDPTASGNVSRQLAHPECTHAYCTVHHHRQWQRRVSPTPCTCSPTQTAGVRYLPMMVSRIMLSLRKAADTQQRGEGWSLADPSGNDENTRGLEFFRPRRDLSGTLDDIPLYSRPDTESTLR